MDKDKNLINRLAVEETVKNLCEELNAITTIYNIEFVRKDNGEKEPFATFYGATFHYDEGMDKEQIINTSKSKDGSILAELEDLEKLIEEYVGDDDFITGLHQDIDFTQFHGDDHKNMSIRDNAIYCETADEAFEKFKFYYELAKHPEFENDADALNKFFQSDLFQKLKKTL